MQEQLDRQQKLIDVLSRKVEAASEPVAKTKDENRGNFLSTFAGKIRFVVKAVPPFLIPSRRANSRMQRGHVQGARGYIKYDGNDPL